VGAAAGAVQQQDGIVGVALGVAVQRAEREVVEVQIGERLARAEAEVMNVEALVRDGPVSRRVLRLRSLGGSGERKGKEETAGTLQHEVLLRASGPFYGLVRRVRFAVTAVWWPPAIIGMRRTEQLSAQCTVVRDAVSCANPRFRTRTQWP